MQCKKSSHMHRQDACATKQKLAEPSQQLFAAGIADAGFVFDSADVDAFAHEAADRLGESFSGGRTRIAVMAKP